MSNKEINRFDLEAGNEVNLQAFLIWLAGNVQDGDTDIVFELERSFGYYDEEFYSLVFKKPKSSNKGKNK